MLCRIWNLGEYYFHLHTIFISRIAVSFFFFFYELLDIKIFSINTYNMYQLLICFFIMLWLNEHYLKGKLCLFWQLWEIWPGFFCLVHSDFDLPWEVDSSKADSTRSRHGRSRWSMKRLPCLSICTTQPVLCSVVYRNGYVLLFTRKFHPGKKKVSSSFNFVQVFFLLWLNGNK